MSSKRHLTVVPRCAPGLEGSALGHGPDGLALLVADAPGIAVLADFGLEPGGQGVGDGGADAMQPPGDLVPASAELAAAVQLREHDVYGGEPGLLVDLNRDTTAIVGDLDHVAVQQFDDDGLAVAAQSLVDGVVDDLPDQVVQPPRGGRPDVHAGA